MSALAIQLHQQKPMEALLHMVGQMHMVHMATLDMVDTDHRLVVQLEEGKVAHEAEDSLKVGGLSMSGSVMDLRLFLLFKTSPRTPQMAQK